MYKRGDMVLILDQGCIEHTDSSYCCDCDLTKPVKVIDVDFLPYWVTVKLPNGGACDFRPTDLRLVKETNE